LIAQYLLNRYRSSKSVSRAVAFHIVLLILLLLAFKKETESLHTTLPTKRRDILPPLQLKRRQVPTSSNHITMPVHDNTSPTIPSEMATAPAVQEATIPFPEPHTEIHKPYHQEQVPTVHPTPMASQKNSTKPISQQQKKDHVHAWDKANNQENSKTQNDRPAENTGKIKHVTTLIQEFAQSSSAYSGTRLETEGIETVIELTNRVNKSFKETALSRYITESYYTICTIANRTPFYPQSDDRVYPCVIYLTINRDGTITDIETKKECASLATNEICDHITNALRKLGALRPLPHTYEQNTFILPIPINISPEYYKGRSSSRDPLIFFLR